MNYDPDKLYGFIVGCTLLSIVDDRTAFQQYAERVKVHCGTIVEWARLYNAFLLESAGWQREENGQWTHVTTADSDITR